MRTVAIIQARMSSKRLPGKVLMDLGGLKVLGWSVRAAKAIPGVDSVVVATSVDTDDDKVAAWCSENDTLCVRGPLNDVLARYAMAARQENADIVMRLTADCPLLDPHVCGQVLQLLHATKSDYVNNASPRVWPDGTDCEVFTAKSLYEAELEAKLPAQREHVTPFMRYNYQRYTVHTLTCPMPGLANERWTIDYQEDYDFLTALVKHLPKDRAPSYMEVMAAIRNHNIVHKPIPHAAPAAVSLENQPERSFVLSQSLLPAAQSVIPQGSQTYSKSFRQFPLGHTPLFLTHGEGGRVWDVDGNDYVDLICALMPIMLGYSDPDIDYAIRDQLNRGISFSLPTTLETELAKRITQLVPCADKVRFGKNGSDATAACIRLARAFTGRERVMVCGYHGWQDWYIGTTSRFKGVPTAVSDLAHAVPYNDLAAVEAMLMKHKGEFAAMIMEAVNMTIPDPGFLQGLKDLLHKHGAILIFDEVITGFRLAKGGAQEYFGVTPDLAAFGKAMGNGMPISAVTGRGDIMDEMDQIFFSGTFGGEALSLAASIAVMDKIVHEPVIETLWKKGDQLRAGVDTLLKKYKLEGVILQKGLAPWVILAFQPQPNATAEAIKTLFITQLARYGVLCIGSQNVCYAHSDADIAQVLAAYDLTFKHLAGELAGGNLEKNLPCPVVYPAFKVR